MQLFIQDAQAGKLVEKCPGQYLLLKNKKFNCD